jgi:predicted phage terminase large subunit-like protein
MGGRMYVIDSRLWREEIPTLRRNLRDIHARYKVAFLIENKANGMTLIQDLRHGIPEANMPALPVIEFTPDGMDKTQRAYSVINYVAGGLVYLPEGGPWVDEWVLQHKQFPKGAHDDLVDTTAMAVTWLAKHTAEIRSLLLQPLPAPLIASSYQPGEVYHGGYYTR